MKGDKYPYTVHQVLKALHHAKTAQLQPVLGRTSSINMLSKILQSTSHANMVLSLLPLRINSTINSRIIDCSESGPVGEHSRSFDLDEHLHKRSPQVHAHDENHRRVLGYGFYNMDKFEQPSKNSGGVPVHSITLAARSTARHSARLGKGRLDRGFILT